MKIPQIYVQRPPDPSDREAHNWIKTEGVRVELYTKDGQREEHMEKTSITIKRVRLLHDSYTGKDAEFSNQTAKLITHTLSAPTDDVEWSLAIPHPEILEFLRDEFAIESIVCTPTANQEAERSPYRTHNIR